MKDLLPRMALSVRQPWAWALFHGKPVENRSFAAVSHGMITGPLCIHASMGMTRREYEHARGLMLECGVVCPAPADLVRGGIIGTVEVTRIAMPGDKELEGNPWYFGECGLVLAKQVELAAPIPVGGALGYFDWRRKLNDIVNSPIALVPPAKWMTNWQPKCQCDESGEVCGIPRGQNNLIHEPSGYCVRCGHKDRCHTPPPEQDPQRALL